MRLIKRDVDRIIAPFVNRKGFLCGRIFLEWKQIVGEEIFQLAEPYRTVVTPKGPGTLVLNTKSSSAFLLSSLEEDILAKINTYFDKNLIQKIQYKHTLYKTKEKPKPEAVVIDIKVLQDLSDAVEQIEDEALRQILKRMGISILTNQRIYNGGE